MMVAYCYYLLPNPCKSFRDVRAESEQAAFESWFRAGHKYILLETGQFYIDVDAWEKYCKRK